jgi:hypothetical protein
MEKILDRLVEKELCLPTVQSAGKEFSIGPGLADRLPLPITTMRHASTPNFSGSVFLAFGDS